ncbi:hypothetical protein ACFV19_31865 [Streptomyces griseoluteus]|uniref:hypothetical protein n=1 Tax=Streptomyces griseoluteus TaxID=29306 RepID=UPI0036D0FC1C
MLFFTETEAREWATTGKKAANGPNPAALSTQASPVPMQKPPTPDAQPAAAPADSLADAWSTTPPTAAPDPVPAPTADPGDATPPAAPAPVDDDQAVGPPAAAEHHLPYTLAALRYARANDPTFPKPVGKRGAEFLYRVGDLKKWARNRPRVPLTVAGSDGSWTLSCPTHEPTATPSPTH